MNNTFLNKNELNSINTAYEAEYSHIFEHINPVLNAERFTEENQTINFFNALKKIYGEENIYAWFEYPWKIDGVTFGNNKKSSYRFDAVIFVKNKNNDKGNLLIVEAKCLRGDTKYTAINSDFCRILGCNSKLERHTNNTNKKLIKLHISKDKIENIYTVILADYWKKRSAKFYKNINERWMQINDNKQNDLFDKFQNTVQNAYKKNYTDTPLWNEPIHVKDIKDTNNKYYLLTLFSKINNYTEIFDFM